MATCQLCESCKPTLCNVLHSNVAAAVAPVVYSTACVRCTTNTLQNTHLTSQRHVKSTYCLSFPFNVPSVGRARLALARDTIIAGTAMSKGLCHALLHRSPGPSPAVRCSSSSANAAVDENRTLLFTLQSHGSSCRLGKCQRSCPAAAAWLPGPTAASEPAAPAGPRTNPSREASGGKVTSRLIICGAGGHLRHQQGQQSHACALARTSASCSVANQSMHWNHGSGTETHGGPVSNHTVGISNCAITHAHSYRLQLLLSRRCALQAVLAHQLVQEMLLLLLWQPVAQRHAGQSWG